MKNLHRIISVILVVFCLTLVTSCSFGKAVCTECGKLRNSESNFCIYCGYEFPKNNKSEETKLCSSCGEENAKGNSFCFACGSQLNFDVSIEVPDLPTMPSESTETSTSSSITNNKPAETEPENKNTTNNTTEPDPSTVWLRVLSVSNQNSMVVEEYDYYGRKIRSTMAPYSSTIEALIIMDTTYDQNGFVIGYINDYIVYNTKTTGQYVNYFQETKNGTVIDYRYHYQNGEFCGTDQYYYDNSGVLTAIDHFDENNYLEEREYYDNGKLVQKCYGDSTLKSQYRYNASGLCTDEIHYNSDGSLESTVKNTYDSYGNCIKTVATLASNNKVTTTVREYWTLAKYRQYYGLTK